MEEPAEQAIDRYDNIDDKFVTKGRGSAHGRRKKVHRNSFGSDSSFTISTPSNSVRSSLSSLVEDLQPDHDLGEGPDPELLQDYCLALSQVLDEEGDEDNVPPEAEHTPRTEDTLQVMRTKQKCITKFD